MGIIQKAGDIKRNSTLVFGEPGTGKTTIVGAALSGLNPLWITLTNIPEGALESHWDVALISDKKDFMDVYRPAINGEFNYDAVVIDGFGPLLGVFMDAEPKTFANGSERDLRQIWQTASNQLSTIILKLLSTFDNVFVILNTKSEEGEKDLDINPYLKRIILSYFTNKWYCSISPQKDKDGNTIGTNYHVQTNPVYALRFKENR